MVPSAATRGDWAVWIAITQIVIATPDAKSSHEVAACPTSGLVVGQDAASQVTHAQVASLTQVLNLFSHAYTPPPAHPPSNSPPP